MTAPVEDKSHALLSPSGAHTWIACAPAVAVSRGQPDKSSEYADEGTAAHTLMHWCLSSAVDAHTYAGCVIAAGDHSFEVGEEMIEAVQRYVDAVRQRVHELELAGATVQMLVEQVLPIDHITGEKGAKGTSDTILIAVWSDVHAEIEVWDLKYGRGVPVEAEQNYQAMLYAAGALEIHSLFYDFAAINCVIFQPRISETPSEWKIDPASLNDWIKNVATPAAERALLYLDSVEFAPPALTEYNPGEKQCRFCKARAVCPALAKHVEQTLGADFESITEAYVTADIALLDNERLGRIYPTLPIIEMWGKAVLARIEHELLAGNTVPGAKLVQGRRGARKWVDEGQAEQLLKGMRLKQEQMYSFKLISPTQAEKLLAKDAPRRWKKVEALVTQPPGAPSVAPESDKRMALVIEPVDAEFEVEPDVGDLL